MLTVSYKKGNISFAIYADDPADTMIAVAFQDNIVGYYKSCAEYTAPAGYKVTEYRDTFGLSEAERNLPGAGCLYSVLVLREDVSISFPALTDGTHPQKAAPPAGPDIPETSPEQ